MWLLIQLSLALGLSATATAQAPSPAIEYREGRILVAPKPGLSEARFNEILSRVGSRARARIPGLDVRIVEVPPQAEQAVARALSRQRHIDFAEVDRLAELSEFVPNDPRFPNQWHLETMRASSAWLRSSGSGVLIAVLDTGVDASHLDLSANLVPGWNSVSGSSDTSDQHGHGTSVAGTIGAITDNGLGVASMAWQARILPVRVSNRSDGAAYHSDIARGITWAADQGARVANVSYEVSSNATISSAAEYMRGLGGMVVISAGNAGTDPGYPPNPSSLVVAATTSSEGTASWSNHGSFIDLAAPGAGIVSTKKGGSFGSVSGTSFSSPLTAAVVGLVMSANPDLTPTDVESVMLSTAVDLGPEGWDSAYGHGRVDAAAAVALAANAIPSDEQPPIVSIVDPRANASVDGLVLVDVDAADDFGVSHVEFLVDNGLVATDSVAPFEFSWDTSSAGEGGATLLARAYDFAGNRGTSEPVPVVVANTAGDDKPPVVTITSPADGATVSGSVSLAAFASDDTAVAEVRMMVDGKLICAGAPSVSCTWNARKSSEGEHTVTATATDTGGNAASDAVTVTVGASTKGGGKDKGGGGKGGGKGPKSN